jgi:hypothetical protein
MYIVTLRYIVDVLYQNYSSNILSSRKQLDVQCKQTQSLGQTQRGQKNLILSIMTYVYRMRENKLDEIPTLATVMDQLEFSNTLQRGRSSLARRKRVECRPIFHALSHFAGTNF